MARTFTFETLSRREVADLTRDAQEPYTLLGYEDTEGQPRGLVGDEVGPYVHAIARASTDGGADTPANVPEVADGESQRLLTDEFGRLWVNVNTSAAEVQNVQGNIANDSPDADSNPVKVGGVAVAVGSTPTAVTAGDRVNAAASPSGALHTLTSPNPLTDATTYVYSVTPATVGDASGRLVIKASPGRVRRVLVVNNDVATRYAQVHNTTAVGTIATGTMLTPGMPIPAGGFGYFDFSEADLACSSGIAVALSTTQTTYTAVAVTGQFSAQYA